MQILLTGATGLLGGNLARLLASRDYGRLRVLARKTSNRAALQGLEHELFEGDIRDREAMERAAQGCEAVFHCAASVSQWRSNLAEMRAINIEGTVNVLAAALRAGARRVVYVSTVDTLGLSSREAPADESARLPAVLFRFSVAGVVDRHPHYCLRE